MKIVNLVLNNFIQDSRVLKTSRSLINMGFDVKVVALHDSNLPIFEQFEGINIHRIPLKSRSWSKIKFIQFFKLFELIIRFISKYRSVSVLHCNDLSALLIGFLTKLTNTKLKIVYDSHEFAINDKPNQAKYSIKINYFLEKFLIRFADVVIVVSESIAIEYSRLYKIPTPHIVLNCPIFKEQEKNNLFREKFNLRNDQIIFLYQGVLSRGRGLEILLQAFKDFNSEEYVLVCMGYGPLENFVQEEAEKYPNIFFQPAVSPDLLLKYTSSADFGISFIEDACLSYRYCLPNKMFEYLMAGLPIITSNLYEMKHFVETEGVGIVAKENTVQGFINAVEVSLEQDYQAIQRNVYKTRKKYCWEEQELVLDKVFHGFF